MPKDALDIAVNAGDLVGIIQKKDPMGNTKRWFVDNGITQVFILPFIPIKTFWKIESANAIFWI